MKPIIGIVGRPHTTNTDRYSVCVLDGYRVAVSKSEGIPIVLLPTQNVCYERTRPKDAPKLTETEKEDLIRQINLCDGIILPGGNRIYDYDYFICDYAFKNSLKVLGICMGMQLMACVDYGEDRSKIIKRIDNKDSHNKLDEEYVHKVKLEEGSKLFSVIGQKEVKVNSRHKYSITNTKNMDIVGFSEEGLIEAIEMKDKEFAIGVQWHPEDMVSYDNNMKKIFDEFVRTCKK